MKNSDYIKGCLLLEDGTVYEGRYYKKNANNNEFHYKIGEVVFNTSMSGYQEILTDPSYCEQIILMTSPLIGNYGINHSHNESNQSFAIGMLAKEFTDGLDHPHAHQTIRDFFEEQNLDYLDHIDTRSLTNHIRINGTLKGTILPFDYFQKNKNEIIKKLKNTLIIGSVDKVTTKHAYTHSPTSGIVSWKLTLLDFGCKKNIIHSFLKRDCQITVLPARSDLETILKTKPQGIILSNGPGDPKELLDILPTIQTLLNSYPIFGICLGHQLLALTLGFDTVKMPFGHRGANHPVIDKIANKVILTSQNHGYSVLNKKRIENNNQNISSNGEIQNQVLFRFIHNNDGTIEGFTHNTLPIFSVQFHPEANPGPLDSQYLFDDFINILSKFHHSKKETRL